MHTYMVTFNENGQTHKRYVDANTAYSAREWGRHLMNRIFDRGTVIVSVTEVA